MKRIMMTILAATFVGFTACNEPAATEEVAEEVVEVVEEAPVAEEAAADTAAVEAAPAE